MSGDNEFLCRIYGLSDASGNLEHQGFKNIYKKTMLRTAGRHCCLWCHIKSSDLKIPLSDRGRSLDRTLQNLKSGNDKFLQAGGNIKNSKHFNNVIDKAMFDIPLTQVSHQIAKSFKM